MKVKYDPESLDMEEFFRIVKKKGDKKNVRKCKRRSGENPEKRKIT